MGLADRHYQRYDHDKPPRDGAWFLTSPAFWLVAVHAAGLLYCILNSRTAPVWPGLALYFITPLAFHDLQLWRLFTYVLAEDNYLPAFIYLPTLYLTAIVLGRVWSWRRLVLSYLLLALIGALAAALAAFFFHPQIPYLIGPAAPVLGLLTAAATHFAQTKDRLPYYTNDTVSLAAFAAVLAVFQVIIVVLTRAPWLSLPACAGAMLTAFFWVTFQTGPRQASAAPALQPADSASRRTATLHAVRPADKTQEELDEAAEIEALEAQVDRILEKVALTKTLASLTEEEKRILQRATELKNQKPARR